MTLFSGPHIQTFLGLDLLHVRKSFLLNRGWLFLCNGSIFGSRLSSISSVCNLTFYILYPDLLLSSRLLSDVCMTHFCVHSSQPPLWSAIGSNDHLGRSDLRDRLLLFLEYCWRSAASVSVVIPVTAVGDRSLILA